MKMTHRIPNNWRELEGMVAEVFNNAGYDAFPHHTITTVRGKKEIDVYVSPRKELDPIILCECKFWKQPVNQEVVHSFRTVVQDSGAGLGFIITKSGFQKGAYSAAQFSNVKLVTWDEFLEFFLEDWLNFKRLKLLHKAKPLGVYTDPIDIPFDSLDQKKRKKYIESVQKYARVQMLATLYKPVNRLVINKYNEFFNESINTYEEYFDGMSLKTEEALLFYDELFDGINIPFSNLFFDIEEVSNITSKFIESSFDREDLNNLINEFNTLNC
ncbi:restriction endonuclease [Aerococcus urinaeequi]|uniref:restriction endonuclease n=1 Tax=Aerococcus urinaeequi TaxID=51665 RepID=UPI003D6A46D4